MFVCVCVCVSCEASLTALLAPICSRPAIYNPLQSAELTVHRVVTVTVLQSVCVCTLLQGASLTRSLSLPHTQPFEHFPFSHTFTVHTHHCACMGHTASTRDAAQCHELSQFCWPALFTEAEKLFLFYSFLSYVTSYVNCQATNTRTHTHA